MRIDGARESVYSRLTKAQEAESKMPAKSVMPIGALLVDIEERECRVICDQSQSNVERIVNSVLGDSHYELAIWTNPISQPKNEISKFVYVLRCDGMTPEEIKERQRNTIDPEIHPALETFVFAPLKEGFKPIGKHAGRRASTQRWEIMAISDSRFMRSPLRDVKRVLGNAIVTRNLPWEFRLTRMRQIEIDSGKPTAVWRIMRIK